MIRVLANDGIEQKAIEYLHLFNVEVVTQKIDQADLANGLHDFDALVVRSATQVGADVLENQPRLKFVGRAGVGMDNIDLPAAKSLGIYACNTPAASSQSVAELAIAHLFSLARGLHVTNRAMASQPFNDLKKAYSKGFELSGRMMGVWGFGRIGRATASLANALGMTVLTYDPYLEMGTMNLEGNATIIGKDELLASSDVISFHVPFSKNDAPLFAAAELEACKKGVILINCSRGGVIDEDVLLEGLNSKKIAGAGLDVFVGEPNPRPELLNHALISVSPHIGASTLEAQERIGQEMAESIVRHFGLNQA
jgi:D-3-phosphoglycerate dehydrogenase